MSIQNRFCKDCARMGEKQQVNIRWRIAKCPSCGLINLDETITEDDIRTRRRTDMSNYDGGWLFKCCPNETPCECANREHIDSLFPYGNSGFCADHCDRTPHCAGSKVKPPVQVGEDHLQAWYEWAGRILDEAEERQPDNWRLNCACARLRVVIDDLRKLQEKFNDLREKVNYDES
jgi:hypothetical protein